MTAGAEPSVVEADRPLSGGTVSESIRALTAELRALVAASADSLAKQTTPSNAC